MVTKKGLQIFDGVEFRDLDTDDTGMPIALIYGIGGVGKTVSSILSAPTKILYIQGEKRNVKRTLLGNIDNKWLAENVRRLNVYHFEGLLDFLCSRTNQDYIASGFKSVIADGTSYLMNTLLLGEIEEETGEAEVFDKKDRPLVNRARTDQTGYGSLAGLMKRFCDALLDIASRDVFVLLVAQLDDVVKWDKDLAAAPAFAGKEFNRDLKPVFDLIGLTTQRFKKSKDETTGKIITTDIPEFPPGVRFYSPDNDFLAKWSGPRIERPAFFLNWEKILSFSTGEGKTIELEVEEVEASSPVEKEDDSWNF